MNEQDRLSELVDRAVSQSDDPAAGVDAVLNLVSLLRCGSCRHWHDPWAEGAEDRGDWYTLWERFRPEDDLDFYPDYAKPVEDEHGRWGACTLIDLPERRGEKPSVPAYTQDGSDYAATLYCRSDFGCVLWQPREED